jgi:parallel beta-helix repeat protein
VAQAVPADAEADAPEGMIASLREADGAAGEAVEAAWMASGPQCGAVLTRSVTLRQDLGPCPDIGLVLGADDITLDCDGHRILGAPGASIGVTADGPAGLHVKNCHIEGFGGSIVLRHTIGSYVEHNTLRSVDIIAGVGDTVRGNTLGPGSSEMSGDALRFTDNTIAGPQGLVLVFGNGVRVSGNDIEGSIELDGPAHRIDHNTLQGGDVLVEDTTGTRIEYNTLEDGAQGFSVLEASHNRFVRNEVEGSETFGFLIWGGSRENLLRDNEAHDNTTVGFELWEGSDGNVLQDNEACGNGEADLRDHAAGTVLLDNDFCVVDAP